MGTPLPLPKKGAEPPTKFSAHVYSGQTAGRIKMPLGTEVDLSPGDSVLDGDPAPPPHMQRGWSPSPILDPSLLWPNGWMHQNATWYMEVGLGPGDTVLDGDPAPPRSPLPNFRPMSVVAKRLDGSRRHLVWRWALVQATLCYMGTQLPSQNRRQSPQFSADYILRES